MAKQQTRTSGGAYQNPTEGIVDYGAFGRGVEKGIKPGLDFLKAEEKRKKEEEEKEKKSLTFDSNVNKSSGQDFSVGQAGANSLQLSLKTDVSILGKEWLDAKGDVQKQKKVFDKLNRMDVGKKRAVAFLTSLAKNFNASDRRLMPDIVPGLQIERFEESLNKGNGQFGFGKDEAGSEVFGMYINTVDTDFDAFASTKEFSQNIDLQAAIKKDPSLKKRLGLDINLGNASADSASAAAGFSQQVKSRKYKKIFIPTENLTEDEIMLKYFKPPSNLSNNIDETVKDDGIDTKINEADIVKDVTSGQYIDNKTGNIITTTDTTQVLSENGYEKIDRAAEQVGNQIITKGSYRENKDSLYIDAVFGTRKDIALNSQTPIGPYIKGFGEEGFKFAGKSYTEADFLKIGSNGKIGGDIPLSVRNAVSKSYAVDRYKIEKGSFGYHENEFGHATRSAIPADTRQVTKLDKGSGSIKTENETVDLLFNEINKVPEDIVYTSTRTSQNIPMTTRSDVNITRLLNAATTNESSFKTNKEFKSFFFELKRNEGIEEDEIKKQYNTKISENKGSNIWLKKGDVYTGLDVNSKEKLIEAMVNAVDYDGMNKLIIQSKLKDKFGIKPSDKYNK